MTGKELDEIFGQQDPPNSDTFAATFAAINAINYKLTDVAMLIDRLLPEGIKKENVFKKLIEVKAALDSAAIHSKKD